MFSRFQRYFSTSNKTNQPKFQYQKYFLYHKIFSTFLKSSFYLLILSFGGFYLIQNKEKKEEEKKGNLKVINLKKNLFINNQKINEKKEEKNSNQINQLKEELEGMKKSFLNINLNNEQTIKLRQAEEEYHKKNQKICQDISLIINNYEVPIQARLKAIGVLSNNTR